MMRPSLFLRCIGFSSILVAACGGDSFESGPPSAAGAAGAAGASGNAGASSGSAGAGMSGASGQAGGAGEGGAGAAGQGGQAGEAGASGAGAGGDAGQGGAGGDAGQGGAAGDAGQGGAGSGGGAAGDAGAAGANACVGNAPPKISAKNLTLGVADSLPFDVSFSDPEGDELTLSWVPAGDAGAPTLDSTTTATPKVTPKECGEFTFSVTAKDTCGNATTENVKVTVTGNGPHVSNTLCSASAPRCGTVSNPWCDLSEAFSSGARDLKVHGSGVAYSGDLVVPDKGSITGGFSDKFDTSNTNPAINATIVETKTTAGLQIAKDSKARLIGFNLRQVAKTGEAQSALSMSASASVELTSMLIDAADLALSSEAYGVKIFEPNQGTAGSLKVLSSTIVGPSSVSSFGIRGIAGTKIDVSIDKSTIEGGDSPDKVNPSFSTGLSLDQSLSLTVIDSELRGGVAGGSTQDKKFLGASQVASQGAIVVGLDSLSISGAKTVFAGQGAYGGSSAGFQAIGVKQITISGGSFLGVEKQASSLLFAVGLQIFAAESPSNDAMPFVISGITAQGGPAGDFRLGMQLGSSLGSIKNSEIVGSKVPGGHTTIGLSVLAAEIPPPAEPPAEVEPQYVPFPAGELVVESNTDIVGGSPESVNLPGLGNPVLGYQAVGLRVDGTVPATLPIHVLKNQRLLGCLDKGCGSSASRMRAGKFQAG